MAEDAIAALRALLASNGAAPSLPAHLNWNVRLGIARELIARGDLAQAVDILDAGAPDDPDQRREVAARWLLLARLLDRVHPAQSGAVEQALSHAVDADPVQGRPALAQHYQRLKQWSAAADLWRDVIAADPTEPSAYLSLARMCEKLGKYEQALAIYLRLVEAAPTARSYLTVAARLTELAPSLSEVPAAHQIRIALIGNATLDHLGSYVTVDCYRAGLRPTLYQAGFDQVTQEILDPGSGLYHFGADVLICALHASRVFPRLHHNPFDLSLDERRSEVDSGLVTLGGLLDAFTQRSSALVLVHNMVAPQHPALGLLDWRDELGQAELFGEINRRLAELVRTSYQTVYVVDEDRIQSRTGKARATDPRLWHTARVAWSESVHLGLASEYVRYLKAARGLTRKCIVLDLDNTLWGGVVGEDGVEGLQLGADAPGNAFVSFQHELERLWRRGILLAVCSKNNFEDAAPVFEHHPAMVLKWTHIAAHRINWQSKAANLRELATELNIGLDSLVFLDDNPVERAAVRSELPDVLVPELPNDPAQYRAALLELDVFESLGLTNEDRQRGQLYAEQARRREFEASTRTTSLEDYLAELKMVVDIGPAQAADLGRIAQLTNKTNQFNLTTHRYTEAELVALQADGSDVFGMRVADRFGDNGLVGVAIVQPLSEGAREVDTLLLSCRVMGRGVEGALLRFVAEQARSAGATCLRGRFIPTAKNSPARDCYARCGFSRIAQLPDGSEVWELDLARDRVAVGAWLGLLAVAPG